MSDEDQAKTEADEAKARQNTRDNELKAVRDVLATKAGRALVWRQLSRLNIFGNPFVVGSPDLTAFNCGERNAGLWLLAEVMEAAPEAYILMQEEHRQ